MRRDLKTQRVTTFSFLYTNFLIHAYKMRHIGDEMSIGHLLDLAWSDRTKSQREKYYQYLNIHASFVALMHSSKIEEIPIRSPTPLLFMDHGNLRCIFSCAAFCRLTSISLHFPIP